MASGWTQDAPGGWPGPTFSVAEGLCVLEGLALGVPSGQAIAYLPVDCWPMRRLIFGTNNGGGQIQRVETWIARPKSRRQMCCSVSELGFTKSLDTSTLALEM